MRKILFFFIILFFLVPSWSGAWDDKSTHPAFTEQAVRNTVLFKKGVLKSQLGFEGQIEEYLYNGKNTLSIIEWLTRGSEKEDDPMCRAANHFHNPWKPWEESKLTDSPRNGGSSHHA
ncbi:MAG: hypothetical protein D3910_01875 [Candidatus Electrothrix sp. ATG2]|nr:hypothetical protein [Candidatus Electrothrix sp. ATG2]